MIKIANPAYDVVFKYLMEDNKIAKLLLSDLLQEKIVELEFRPQEYSLKIPCTVYRLDFKAKIKTTDNKEKIVLIEVQKAKFPTDIIRFRRYLGEQYASEQNITEKQDGTFEALPLITVYFLGYNLETNPPYPVLRIRRTVTDNATNESIDLKDPFIEGITHDCIIVQIPKLKKVRRNELELILSLFDERERSQEISINENDYPEKYQAIIRRLLKAVVTEKVRKSMKIEDEIIAGFKAVERVKENLEQELEQEKQRAEQEKQRAEQLEQEKIDMIKEMLSKGIPKQLVMQIAKVDETFLKEHRLL